VIATDLVVVVTDADGNTKTLDSDAPDPADRPRGIQFGTQIQSGFYTGGWSLRRAIDRDNVDLSLGDDVKIIGTNGDTAYEGFVQALPRSMDENGHTLNVTTAGWMAHASDRPFTEIFVDRDMSAWQPPSRQLIVSNTTANRQMHGFELAQDDGGQRCIVTSVEDAWAAPQKPIVDVMYDAGQDSLVSSVYYSFVANAALIAAPVTHTWYFVAGTDDHQGGAVVGANLRAASGNGTFTPTAPKRYVWLEQADSATPGGLAGARYQVYWDSLAVYGNTGIPQIGIAPYGVAASDVIKYLANLYCPLLSTAAVQTTTYPIAHLVFKDDTTVYDAMLKVNSYHLWKLAVWEDRTLYYDQIDLSDWDWEIRHDEVGNQIGLQGDDLAGLRNGIVVQFTNAATGAVERLMPADHPELRDDSLDNPYTAHGRTVYGSPFVVPFPTTTANALELGRLQLLEDNQAKAPGSFTVAHQIKDRAGNYQPVWKVRAGDRIRLTSSANLSDRPRLIQETSYSHDGRSMTIAVDSTLRYLEGFVDRVQTSLQANGLAA
jgi:hypothetical protein